MKILVANIGSTSLKWRLFDCSDGGERLLHKGGFEGVSDYPKAIDDCLGQLRDAKAITNERDLAAVGFKTIIARDVTGCVRLDERVLGAMAAYNGLAPAHNPPYINGIKLFARRMPTVPLVAGSASQSGALPGNPAFFIGGLAATVTGSWVISPGLYQFDVVVPSSTADGDISVTASYGGVSTAAGAFISVQHVPVN